ncbi:hypothetical protein [Kordia jejudonensis]|uniref:hypothetical protein n=1 Tax=Kordia jejudonensis TaxID=1348245 RepID=UPI00062927B7|nr:hypothetical protein [Kordia jejudonensis]
MENDPPKESKGFKTVFRENYLKIGYVLIVTLIVSIAFIVTIRLYYETAETMVSIFEKRDITIQKALNAATSDIREVTQLKEQFRMIADIKESYLYIFKTYSAYNYTFSGFFTVFSVLSGILGFLVLKGGWDNTKNYYLKATFIGVFFCSTLFGILPNVFATKDNIKNNLAKYNYYSGLQLDIYELINDNHGYIKRNTKGSIDTLNLKISDITKGIKENQSLHFEIHIDKVPTDIQPLP